MSAEDILQIAERRKTTVASAALTIDGADRPFRYFESGQAMVADVLAGKTYPLVPFIKDVQVVLDVGANVGAASLYFHSAYPAAKIFAFEPFSECYALLAANVEGIAAIAAHDVGLDDHSRRAELHLSKYDFATNSIGTYTHNTEECETIVLEAALDQARKLEIRAIDILKVDTEGCEVAIISSLLGAYAPRVIYLEYHSDNDRRTLDAMLHQDYLLYFGAIPTPHRGELCYVRCTAIPDGEPLLNLEVHPV